MASIKTTVVVSKNELWSWMIHYVFYMDSHNQISNVTELIDSILDPDNSTAYTQTLHSMFSLMAKYGLPENFPKDGSSLNSSQPMKCNQTRLTKDNQIILNEVGYWLEGVSQATIGIVGILGNIIAMKIFLSGGAKFNTIFYRLLVILLFTQTCYVSFSLIVFLCHYHNNVFFVNVMFTNGLYPLPSLMLHTSTILTMQIAWHRFKATNAPLDYLVSWKFVNATKWALKSLAGSVFIGLILVIPLFFEPTLEAKSQIDLRRLNKTHKLLVSFNELYKCFSTRVS
jgi:hypothetical protein